MGKYILRRLLQMIPVILGATFIIFAMVFALPGDPTAGKCGERPCSAGVRREVPRGAQPQRPAAGAVRQVHGQVRPGRPRHELYGIPVKEDLAKRYPITGQLAVMAIVFETVIGILAGVLAGVRKGRFIDNLVTVSTLFVISIPVFVIGVLAAVPLRRQVGALPRHGAEPATHLRPRCSCRPSCSARLSIAYVARLTRTNLVENLRADYVRTAVAKGLTRRRAVGVHTLRNSLIPVVTFIGADFGGLLGGAIVTERIFNIQGVGGYIWTGHPLPRRCGRRRRTVTVLVIVFLLVNLLVDLLYGVLDPRISHD